MPESGFLFRVLTAKWKKKWIAESNEETFFFSGFRVRLLYI